MSTFQLPNGNPTTGEVIVVLEHYLRSEFKKNSGQGRMVEVSAIQITNLVIDTTKDL